MVATADQAHEERLQGIIMGYPVIRFVEKLNPISPGQVNISLLAGIANKDRAGFRGHGGSRDEPVDGMQLNEFAVLAPLKHQENIGSAASCTVHRHRSLINPDG